MEKEIKKTVEMSKSQFDTIIISLDAACVLARENARNTNMPHMKELYNENAKKYKKEQEHWIKMRDRLFYDD